jgi:ferritin-like metal-binding protein YciE
VEQVFALHGERPSGTKCPAIDGIIKEGGDLMGEVDTRRCQRRYHAVARSSNYEITRYGALIAWARSSTRRGCHHPGAQSQREKAADKKLTALWTGA